MKIIFLKIHFIVFLQCLRWKQFHFKIFTVRPNSSAHHHAKFWKPKRKRKTKKRKENLSFFTQIKRKVLLKWLSIGGAQETKLLSAGIVLNLRCPPRCLKYVLEAMTVGVVAGVFLSLLSWVYIFKNYHRLMLPNFLPVLRVLSII